MLIIAQLKLIQNVLYNCEVYLSDLYEKESHKKHQSPVQPSYSFNFMNTELKDMQTSMLKLALEFSNKDKMDTMNIKKISIQLLNYITTLFVARDYYHVLLNNADRDILGDNLLNGTLQLLDTVAKIKTALEPNSSSISLQENKKKLQGICSPADAAARIENAFAGFDYYGTPKTTPSPSPYASLKRPESISTRSNSSSSLSISSNTIDEEQSNKELSCNSNFTTAMAFFKGLSVKQNGKTSMGSANSAAQSPKLIKP